MQGVVIIKWSNKFALFITIIDGKSEGGTMDEEKKLQGLTEETENEEGLWGEDTSPKGNASSIEVSKVIELIAGLAIWAVFIFIVINAFKSDCVQCTLCGDANNRLFIYANGTSEDGVEYVSCVGPAGCVGCGINSKCWPTECLYVKGASDGGTTTGCVTYYNEGGCITKSEVKSNGTYSENVGCFGISCSGEKYLEVIADSQYAAVRNSCLGVGCGDKLGTAVRGYNDSLPRQFSRGCWGTNKPKEDTDEKGGE